jgi:hypothetical protein
MCDTLSLHDALPIWIPAMLDPNLAAVQWVMLHKDETELVESARTYLANQQWESLRNYSDHKRRSGKSKESAPQKLKPFNFGDKKHAKPKTATPDRPGPEPGNSPSPDQTRHDPA